MEFKRELDELGRVVLPAELRNALELKEKDTLKISRVDSEIHISKEEKL